MTLFESYLLQIPQIVLLHNSNTLPYTKHTVQPTHTPHTTHQYPFDSRKVWIEIGFVLSAKLISFVIRIGFAVIHSVYQIIQTMYVTVLFDD